MRFARIAMPYIAAGLVFAACSDNVPTGDVGPDRQGRVTVRLTDAPFPFDSVKSVDVFVVRVEAKLQPTSEEEAATAVDDGTADASGWVTIAEPNTSFDLLTLRNGVSTALGDATITAGTYQSLRLILDVDQSGVTLNNDMVLTGTSQPNILFPSAGQTGIKIILQGPLTVSADATTDVLIDFDVGQSFIMRGNSLQQNGLLFKPVIKATVQEQEA